MSQLSNFYYTSIAKCLNSRGLNSKNLLSLHLPNQIPCKVTFIYSSSFSSKNVQIWVSVLFYISLKKLCIRQLCEKVYMDWFSFTLVQYTQQNSYSISHLLGTVTTQWLDGDSVVKVVNCRQHCDYTVDQLCSHCAASHCA